ncbi:cytochrome c peroxidase [Dyadobacter sp. LHD-138]|uniref:cytochrome-c peroxidase n=1 Tax=Dyadobacter sp. LHD-138 TaxID=3071413 RepID=UPI0027E03656|nr:cytochrome c peroxidase [Dyadobacter sp. LHD-138]MDQ6481371.1 cytochrome c peroxidase [Dyadobacter sp. LHD-138]
MLRIKKFFIVILSGFAFTLTVAFQAQKEEEVLTKEGLGEKLFFDPVLSRGQVISCASCHIPAFAFADTAAFSIGDKGTRVARNSPALTNLSGRTDFFWDGRASSLEEQILGPLSAHDEMDLPVEQAVERLKKHDFYSAAFQKVFKTEVNQKNLLGAIAAFERTLETTDTPYDRYLDGDEKAMSESAIRGRILFIGKANCATCHSGEDFTADRFKSIGLFNGKELTDTGRFKISKDSAHIGMFKVPGLRNVAVTAPYMHNAMFRTLREVVQYYNTPDKFISNSINRDLSLGSSLNLSDREVDDVVAFLEALTDDRFKKK